MRTEKPLDWLGKSPVTSAGTQGSSGWEPPFSEQVQSWSGTEWLCHDGRVSLGSGRVCKPSQLPYLGGDKLQRQRRRRAMKWTLHIAPCSALTFLLVLTWWWFPSRMAVSNLVQSYMPDIQLFSWSRSSWEIPPSYLISLTAKKFYLAMASCLWAGCYTDSSLSSHGSVSSLHPFLLQIKDSRFLI